MAAQTLSTIKSTSSGRTVPRRCSYFTDTKYVANISALRVEQFAHSGQPGMRPASPLPACNPTPLGFRSLRELLQESLAPRGSIDSRILTTCFLGSGDPPETLEMTLAECVEFFNRAEVGRHLVAADACCELLGCPKSVNQFALRGAHSDV